MSFSSPTRLFKELTADVVIEGGGYADTVWRQKCTIIVVESYCPYPPSLWAPSSPSIVWEIPRVQRVSCILLINAGTSLQQIHKLSECDLAFSFYPPYFKSKNVPRTPMSLQRARTSFHNHLPSLLFLAVSSQNSFIFSKDAALGFRSQM